MLCSLRIPTKRLLVLLLLKVNAGMAQCASKFQANSRSWRSRLKLPDCSLVQSTPHNFLSVINLLCATLTLPYSFSFVALRRRTITIPRN